MINASLSSQKTGLKRTDSLTAELGLETYSR